MRLCVGFAYGKRYLLHPQGFTSDVYVLTVVIACMDGFYALHWQYDTESHEGFGSSTAVAPTWYCFPSFAKFTVNRGCVYSGWPIDRLCPISVKSTNWHIPQNLAVFCCCWRGGGLGVSLKSATVFQSRLPSHSNLSSIRVCSEFHWTVSSSVHFLISGWGTGIASDNRCAWTRARSSGLYDLIESGHGIHTVPHVV